MSGWFRFLSEPMAQALVFLAHNLASAGLAIVIFTLGIKILLVPLTLQQLKSAKAMQDLQPLIKELQAKHKGDKQKLTEETMALYTEHHVNPAAGCLPLVVQLPILYGLYGALLDLGNPKDPLHNDLFSQPFLWLSGQQVTTNGILHGLAAPDPWHILPILCVITQWIQQRMMLGTRQTDPQQAAMQNVMQFMPLMIGFFAWNYASGLALYWAVSTCFSIVQQYFITGWGKLFEVPTFSGLGGLLGGAGGGGGSRTGGSRNGASRNGASGNGRSPRKSAPPAKSNRARTRRG